MHGGLAGSLIRSNGENLHPAANQAREWETQKGKNPRSSDMEERSQHRFAAALP